MERNDRQQVYAEQIGQLYSLEHVALIATLICSLMLVLFHWRVMSRWILLTWFSALAFITLVRSVVLLVYRRSAGAYNQPRKWGRVFIVGAVFSGIGWGTSVIFLFPSGSGQHQLLTLLVLAGMIAGAVGIYSAFMGAFLAFSIPASIPMVVQLFFLPHSFDHNTGIMVLFFLGFIVMAARRVNRAVVTSLELRLENRDLIAFLAEGKDRAEVLNQRLQAEIAERGKVEAELRRHREQLEKTVEERTAELMTANKLLTQQIDTRRQAEESLLESEEKYRNLFEYSNDCIFLHALDGRILDANRKALDEFGFSKSEIQSKNIRDLHPPEVAEAVSRAVVQIRDRGRVSLETSLMRRSGGVFYAEVSSSLFEIRGRQVIQRIVRNITERRIMERELKQTKEYLENVIENAVDAIGIVNQEGKFLLWNKRACEIFGYPAEEMSGKHYSSLYADRTARENLLARLRREGVVRQYEIAMLRKDGHEVPMELSLNLLKDDNGETVGSLCLARDLTEKKRLEAQLLHATRMEAVGTLAGGIAHDFNNVLQAIQGYAQLLLLDRKEPERGYRELQQITRAALRAGELTKQLLTFSRKLEAKLRPTNLNMEVKQCVRLLERTIPKMIAIELRLKDDLKHVNADPTQMEQVLINLAVNAKDAMPKGGRLVIETKDTILGEESCRLRSALTPGPYVLLSVADTGHGMDKETLQHIFDPFFSTKEVGRGTGLGLSIVYGIVKNHGGHIECRSEPGRGSRFDIYLPALELSEESRAARPSKPPRGGLETILLVDDEESIRDIGQQILTRLGYTVLTAADGETALAIYLEKGRQIDLVILDLIMPGMGGRQCLNRLLELNPQLKIIICSGHVTEAESTNPIELGARTVIEKPYDANDLLESVRQVLDNKDKGL
jgi:two-component system cell cycle sensor histidine kinase/response regulator CckA